MVNLIDLNTVADANEHFIDQLTGIDNGQLVGIDMSETVDSSDVNMYKLCDDVIPQSDEDASSVSVNNEQENMWKPDCEDELKPYVGQKFPTIDKGFEFYKEYGRKSGFDVRKSTTKKHYDGSVYLKYLLCSNAGNFENGSRSDSTIDFSSVDSHVSCGQDVPETSESGAKRRRTSSIKCGCHARVVLMSIGQLGYRISLFVESHNHPLASLEGKQFLRCSRTISLHHMNFIFGASKVNVGAKKAFNLYHAFTGSYAEVGATMNDFKNFARDLKLYIGKHDADMILQKFRDKNETSDNGFIYEYETDLDGHLSRIFWASAEGRQSYDVFGDVVSFDATYRTNRYNMIFVPFVGLDNHWKSVTFAAALLSKEDIANFGWVFDVFLKVMGKSPRLIITDQCPAMKAVIPLKFPASSHRLCMWHIMKKFPAKIGTLFCAESPFMKKLNKFVWSEHASPDEFEHGWQSVLKEFDLENHKWLGEMFNIRHCWIPAYFKDEPMIGLLRTTSRSESSNFFFSHFLQKGDTLIEFFLCYESAIERQLYINSRLNHQDASTPKFVTTKPIEKDAATHYTHTIFYKVQEEIKAACFDMELESVSREEDFKIFLIKDPIVKDRLFEVKICISNPYADCSCNLYTRVGYLCRHAFFCLGVCGIHQIPRPQLNNRWLKNAETRHATLHLGQETLPTKKEERIRSKTTEGWFEFQSCITESAGDEESIDFLLSVLKDARKTLMERRQKKSFHSREEVIEELIGVKQFESVTVLPPIETNNKGSRKRIQSSVECNRGGKRAVVRTCKACGQENAKHDSRNCPNKKNQQCVEQSIQS